MRIPACIMVKDEEVNIIKTLTTCLGIIDRLYLLDTGSTDDTVNVVTQFCESNGIALSKFFSEFKFFGPTRNKLIEFAERYISPGDFFMVLDANDELKYENPADLLSEIKTIRDDPNVNIVYIRSAWLDRIKNITDHDKIFLIRAGRNIRYKGYCHEDVTYPMDLPNNGTITITTSHVYQDRAADDLKSLKRLDQDIEYLKQEMIDYRDDLTQLIKSYYFIARIYAGRGNYEESKIYLEKVFELKRNHPTFTGFSIEILYQSHYTYTYILEKTGREWGLQLEHLLKAFNYNRNKIEAIIAIINYYCTLEEYDTAYIFSKHVVGLPFVESASNLMTHYVFSRWCSHAIVCAKLNKIKEGKEAFDKINKKDVPAINKPHYDELYGVYNYMNEVVKKKVILIFGGYSHYRWNPAMLFQGIPIGGSETVIAYNAYYLSKKKDLSVVVCCDCEQETTYEGINIIPVSKFDLFISLHKIDTLIVHRFCDYLRYDENIDKCILVLEDVSPVYTNVKDGQTISFFTKPDVPFNNYNEKLKHIVFKTNWHRSYNLERNHFTRIPRKCMKVIGNAIDTSRFTKFNNHQSVVKTPYRFIYTSCITRGADRIANMIPKILEIIPEATFYFFTNIDFVPEIKTTLSSLPNVFLSNRIPQDELAREILKSDIWLYPTNFSETFCISALEMQLGSVLCICSDLAGLKETVGNRGILVEDFGSDEAFLNVVKDLYDGKINKNTYLENGFNWAMKQDWQQKVLEMYDLF